MIEDRDKSCRVWKMLACSVLLVMIWRGCLIERSSRLMDSVPPDVK